MRRPTLRGLALLLAATVVWSAPAQAANLAVVGEWGGRGSAPGQFNLLTDVLVAPDGSVYTLENGNDRVQRFSPDGTLIGGWGSTGTGDGQFEQAESFAVSAAGEISVADAFQSRVQRFDANGTHQLTWGTFGSGLGQMANPEGIAASGGGTVYVGDRGNSQIDRYEVTGSAVFTSSWGTSGSGPGQFSRLLELAVDGAGNVYAVDRDNGRVQQFTPDGTFIRSFGSSGTGPGQLSQPVDVDVDDDGNVWVADHTNFKLAKFAPNGQLIADYDRAGGQPIRPAAVAVASNGDIYIADTGFANNPRIARLSEVAPPQVGRTVVASVVKGRVLVKAPGSRSFVALTGAASIPVGALVDTRGGTVQLTSASDATGATQTGQFFSGVFKVVQKRVARPVTDLVLSGGSFGRCPSGRRASAGASRTVRKLWGNAKGRFRTTGRYSSATVRGTTWLTTDRCDGTLTRVTAGAVTVRDFARRRNVVVRAPRSYLAAARRR